MEISILVKIDENLDFSQYLRWNRFGTTFSPNLGFGKNFRQMSIGVKICKYVDLGKKKYPKILISVKIFENIDFGQNCGKISNLVKFVEQSRFWTKLSKILDFGQNLAKNVDLGQNIRTCFLFQNY